MMFFYNEEMNFVSIGILKSDIKFGPHKNSTAGKNIAMI